MTAPVLWRQWGVACSRVGRRSRTPPVACLAAAETGADRVSSFGYRPDRVFGERDAGIGMIDHFTALHSISRAWSDRQRPKDWPAEVPVRQLPRPYSGDNSYNGFTGAQRRRGFLRKPEECDLCGLRLRIGFHAEDYVDPLSLVRSVSPAT
jgi:hypothetical protein